MDGMNNQNMNNQNMNNQNMNNQNMNNQNMYNQNMYQMNGQNMYQQGMMYPQPGMNNMYEEPMTVKEWLISFLLLMIPIANMVLPFIWAFSSTEKKSKSNFFKAYLILMLISVILTVILYAVIIFIAIAAGETLY